MFNVTFKNVDQGDTIVVRWSDTSNQQRIGIIDCCLNARYENPLVEHLNILGCEKIDFLILSHPHEDHYSGMLSLIEYVKEREILIDRIINSCASVKENLLSIGSESNDELVKIYKEFRNLRESGLATYYNTFSACEGVSCQFDNLLLEFLSPSIKEIDLFNKSEFKSLNETKNPNSNYLSSIIKISIGKKNVLLTSDALSRSFKRMLNENHLLFESDISLIQIPHHGATSSYHKPFWEAISLVRKKIPAVVSVGKNIYGHPNEGVINSITSLGYEVYATNGVGVFEGLKSEISKKVTAALDLLGSTFSIVKANAKEGDQVISIIS